MLFSTNFQPEDRVVQDFFLMINYHGRMALDCLHPIIGAGNVKEHEAAKYHLILTTNVKLTPDHVVPPFSQAFHHNDGHCFASRIDHGKNTNIHSRGMLGRNTCIALAERRTGEGWQG